MLLAGDIGGTKTTLATYRPEAGTEPIAKITYPSGDYPSFELIVRQFLRDTGQMVRRACFGVAGPVVNNEARVTNLPWNISAAVLEDELGLEQVILLNDLEAIATGVPHLRAHELHTLHEGSAVPGGTIAVVAPGTGLGEAFLTWDGARYQPQSSEGGHADFGPVNELQIGLLHYLLQRYDHVSYERVCSGMAIPNLYSFLRDTGVEAEPAWLAARLRDEEDPTPIIMQAAVEHAPCPLCVATLELFVSILGAEAGNMALKVLSTGGLYIGGGIPPRILPALQTGQFLHSFLHKGRFAALLQNIPVHVILNPEAALFGAAWYLLEKG